MLKKLTNPYLLFTVFLCFNFCLDYVSGKIDRTGEFMAAGEDVVDAVLDKIHHANIFVDDNEFLKRLALVQTDFGNNPDKYAGGRGGIWLVDRKQLRETQNVLKYALANLQAKLDEIETNLISKNWLNVTYKELDKPLYSAIAARLYVYLNNKILDHDINKQGQLWVRFFNSKGNINSFVNLVSEFDRSHSNVCKNQPMDICFVLDSSGSIYQNDFQLAKDFTVRMINPLEIGIVRVGAVYYTNYAHTAFAISNLLKKESMIEEIQNITKPGKGLTWTGNAIFKALKLYNATEKVNNAPRVIIVVTDGNDNDPNNERLSTAMDEVKKENIITFAIGIRNEHSSEEDREVSEETLRIIAQNDTTHIVRLSFKELSNFSDRLNQYRCKLPHQPHIYEEISGVLSGGEKRFYKYRLPPSGLAVDFRSYGHLNAYYSFDFKRPSSAIHDGIINGKVIIRPVDKESSDEQFLYVSVHGKENLSNYTLTTDFDISN